MHAFISIQNSTVPSGRACLNSAWIHSTVQFNYSIIRRIEGLHSISMSPSRDIRHNYIFWSSQALLVTVTVANSSSPLSILNSTTRKLDPDWPYRRLRNWSFLLCSSPSPFKLRFSLLSIIEKTDCLRSLPTFCYRDCFSIVLLKTLQWIVAHPISQDTLSF